MYSGRKPSTHHPVEEKEGIFESRKVGMELVIVWLG